jgi:hypothetical protein
MATKLVTTTALRTRSGDFANLRVQVLSDASYDGVKGLPVSVRAWDHQLRQAILLAAGDAVAGSRTEAPERHMRPTSSARSVMTSRNRHVSSAATDAPCAHGARLPR